MWDVDFTTRSNANNVTNPTNFTNVTNFTNNTNATATDDGYYYNDYYSADDDFYVSNSTATSVDTSNQNQPFTVILLPNNQTVILVGVNATEVAKTPTTYFLTDA